MLLDLMLVLVLTICFITDLKEQRIYNKVIFPSLVIAVILQVTYFGYGGLKGALFGFAAGFGILLIPYLSGGFGAGDVKLLALIGAIKGWAFVINTALYMAVIGGIIALVIIVFHKQTLNFLKQLGQGLFYSIYGIRSKIETPSAPFLKKYPYGVAIVGGAMICLIFKGAWVI